MVCTLNTSNINRAYCIVGRFNSSFLFLHCLFLIAPVVISGGVSWQTPYSFCNSKIPCSVFHYRKQEPRNCIHKWCVMAVYNEFIMSCLQLFDIPLKFKVFSFLQNPQSNWYLRVVATPMLTIRGGMFCAHCVVSNKNSAVICHYDDYL